MEKPGKKRKAERWDRNPIVAASRNRGALLPYLGISPTPSHVEESGPSSSGPVIETRPSADVVDVLEPEPVLQFSVYVPGSGTMLLPPGTERVGPERQPAVVVPSARSELVCDARDQSVNDVRVVPESNKETVQPRVRHRFDEPVVNIAIRGSKALGLSATAEVDQKKLALEDLDRDVSASSAKGPQDSLSKTFILYHQAWYGSEVDPFPLTGEKIWRVAASLKRGKYRAASNYLFRAKDEHEDRGHEWSRRLQRTMKRAIRSCERGIGPAKQAGVIDIVAAVNLGLNCQALVPQGPLSPIVMLTIGCFFGNREIELSLGRFSSFKVSDSKDRLTVHLPVSKTDPCALGCHRSWGCTCVSLMTWPCPLCGWIAHSEMLRLKFGDVVFDQDFPAFPNEDGQFISKTSVVETFEAIANTLTMPLVTETGRRVFGAHTMRVSGAIHLTHIGLEIFFLQILFRWKSNIVLRYASEAPLAKLTNKYKSAVESHNATHIEASVLKSARNLVERLFSQQRDKTHPITMDDAEKLVKVHQVLKPDEAELLKKEVAVLKEAVAKMSSELADNVLEHARESQATDTAKAKTVKPDVYIKSRYNVRHSPTIMSTEIEAWAWQTQCGWAFGKTYYDLVDCLTDSSKEICGTCFPAQKAEAKSQEGGSDSSDDSSSGSSDSSGDSD